MNTLDEGFVEGYVCLSAWADLLDRINVFPVADSDTGVNLRISLGPLRTCGPDRMETATQLVRGAIGNSGNIAAAFLSELLGAESVGDLPEKAAQGRNRAWRAVAVPQGGTMLSVFDSLAEILARSPISITSCAAILANLRETVLATTQSLPDLRLAGVVDAGALGMFIFFEGFFRVITGYTEKSPSLFALFPGRLAISADFHPPSMEAYCVDAIIQPATGSILTKETLALLGDSVVVLPEQSRLKIHIHTADPAALRVNLASLGAVLRWSDEPMSSSSERSVSRLEAPGCVHLMTDAAGSLTRDLARQHHITLLDSYIINNDMARPESLCAPETIYALMRQGHKLTTAQASLAERHRMYQSICEQFGRTLYLAVGSAYTGNYSAAVAWQQEYDPDNLLEVIDTGAASGRLAVKALLVSRLASRTENMEEVRTYAHHLVESCQEYIFIDTLRYLLVGGRVSRTSSFFCDLLQLKPVISPTKEGVRKMGMVRNQAAQLDFALEKVLTEIKTPADTVLLLQYSDNEPWITGVVKPQLQALLPAAEIVLAPLSLTAGVHMGPGTWSLAFAETA
jgi:hypothetical protein